MIDAGPFTCHFNPMSQANLHDFDPVSERLQLGTHEVQGRCVVALPAVLDADDILHDSTQWALLRDQLQRVPHGLRLRMLLPPAKANYTNTMCKVDGCDSEGGDTDEAERKKEFGRNNIIIYRDDLLKRLRCRLRGFPW